MQLVYDLGPRLFLMLEEKKRKLIFVPLTVQTCPKTLPAPMRQIRQWVFPRVDSQEAAFLCLTVVLLGCDICAIIKRD